MSQIILIVRGSPLAQKRHRTKRMGNFIRRYDPSESDKGDFLSIVQSNAPESPIETPISIDMTFYMPVPKSWPKYRKEKVTNGQLIPHCKKPDLSNLVKFVEDALDGVFYTDDKLIYSSHTNKFYSFTPRTIVTIKWRDK